MKGKFNFELVSKNRKYLMGIATILIMVCHSTTLYIDGLIHNDGLRKMYFILRNNSSLGVDIFLVMSALGLYYSFKNNSELKTFYKKRYLRIIPPAIIVTILTNSLVGGIELKNFISRIFLCQFFIDGTRDVWFISFLLIVYLIFPLLYKIREKFGNISMIILSIIFIIIGLLIFKYNPDIYARYEIAFTRFPIFLIGIIIGNLSYEKKEINIGIIFASIFIIILMNSLYYFDVLSKFLYAGGNYFNAILALAFLFLFSYIFSKTKINTTKSILSWIGLYSLEVYLLYEQLIINCLNIFKVNDKYNISYYIFVIMITIILQIALKTICNEIQKIFNSEKSS